MDQANLHQMPELARRFGTLPGLSDHTIGTAASVAAVALGACLIEKHFTLSRTDKGPDSEFSLEPTTSSVCAGMRRVPGSRWAARASSGRRRRRAARFSADRSISPRTLSLATSLKRRISDDIRPGYGLPPNLRPLSGPSRDEGGQERNAGFLGSSFQAHVKPFGLMWPMRCAKSEAATGFGPSAPCPSFQEFLTIAGSRSADSRRDSSANRLVRHQASAAQRPDYDAWYLRQLDAHRRLGNSPIGPNPRSPPCH